MRLFILGCLVSCFVSLGWSAQNPISWSLNQKFPPTVPVSDGSYTVTYTFTNTTKNKLVHPIIIQKYATPIRNFQFIDNCSGKRLAVLAQCTVKVILRPTWQGLKKMHLAITGYSYDTVILPTLTTTAMPITNVKVQGAVTQPLPASMPVGTTRPFTFSFTNAGNVAVTGVTIKVNVPNFSTTCSSRLNVGASCEVSGTFTPTSATPSTQTVTASFDFNQGLPVVVKTSTQVVSEGLSGLVLNPLPTLTTINQDYPVTFQFTNNENVPVSVNQQNTFTQFTVTFNNCPNSGLPFNSHATCTIKGTFNAATSGDYTLTASLVPVSQPPAPVTLTTSTHAQSPTNGRTISFKNQCNFPVWFSLTGGAIKNSPTCHTNADCPLGTQCNTNSNLCYWENYAPNDNIFKLAASSGTNTVFIPEPPPNSFDPDTLWSGVFSASLKCSGATCAVAQCGNNGGNSACAVGVGFAL